MKRLLLTVVAVLLLLPALAQQARWEKLSPMLRQLVRKLNVSRGYGGTGARGYENSHGPVYPRTTVPPYLRTPEVCAFIRISDADVLAEHGCRDLGAVGTIHIASIPVDRLASLSLDPRVLRIEARPTGQLLLDTVARCVNATPVYDGLLLPQAYTGRGVVVGLMDVGFDLTHPTFRHLPLTSQHSPRIPETRIRRFWDMLSTDTVGSNLYVGRDYAITDDILNLGHSRDGLILSHGTHTAGIAAGNGYDSPYRGLAPESDICLVANGVSENVELIDSAMLSRFTFATDALGFKYLFDYARQNSQPCVVSFSEGSGQDFWGYDQLYYEMLDSLLGPGRIMVVAAGNQGHVKSWFSKPAGPGSEGTFVRLYDEAMMLTLKSAGDFTLRLVAYTDAATTDTLNIPLPLSSNYPRTLVPPYPRTPAFTHLDSLVVEAYPNCYDSLEVCYDVVLYSADKQIGTMMPLSVEVLDNQAEVSCWRVNGNWVTNALNPRLAAGETTHNILSPASAPRVICVGATTYRDSIQNVNGQWQHYWTGEPGSRAPFSSVGPTMDGRTKPDVMAPGNNIISAYSSYYLENNPTASDVKWDVAHFDYQGRTYAWNSNTGTSMACPVVAGVIALWLQAKPDLTPEDVMGVISRTSRRPDPDLDYPNNLYGYGEIDAYRGLLDILGIDRIDGVSTTHTPARITLNGRQLIVTFPDGTTVDGPLTLTIYDLDGRQLMRTTILDSSQPSTPASLSVTHLESLPPGIYAVQLDSPAAVSGSTLIRLGK